VTVALVAFTASEQRIVSDFEATDPKDPSYWMDASIEALKRAIKRHYVLAQGYTCCYCRQVYPVGHLMAWTTDHVVPRNSHPQFMFTPLNLAAACHTCNQRKSAKQSLKVSSGAAYPAVGASFFVIHPHFDNYSDHIEHAGVSYTPITEKGGWTYEACGLDRFVEMELGWPEATIADERYEKAVDAIAEGDRTASAAVMVDVDTEAAKEN
jgi:hypothetical protein